MNRLVGVSWWDRVVMILVHIVLPELVYVVVDVHAHTDDPYIFDRVETF